MWVVMWTLLLGLALQGRSQAKMKKLCMLKSMFVLLFLYVFCFVVAIFEYFCVCSFCESEILSV